jgi:hypothetical protein
VFFLVIMYVMDLVLCFLDMFRQYIIWNVRHCTIVQLGFSIWMPQKELPKRTHTKSLATGDMKVSYNPKVIYYFLSNGMGISDIQFHFSLGFTNLVCYHHLDVLRAPATHQPCPEAA